MEGLQNWVRSFSNDTKSGSPSNFPGVPYILRSEGGGCFALSFAVDSTRPPRQLISLWASSKLCAICFVAGIVVGYTLKPRVRGWASGLLKRLKDNYGEVQKEKGLELDILENEHCLESNGRIIATH